MAYRGKRSFFFYGFWISIIALALVGGSALYHNTNSTSEAVTKTAHSAKEGVAKTAKAVKKALDKYKKEEAKKEEVKKGGKKNKR